MSSAESPVPPPVCIVGMHRSGTSMVAHLLHRCGVYLGEEADLGPPAPDNAQGFSENRHFVEINEQLLSRFDGGWDAPPLFPIDWANRPDLSDLRQEAQAQIERMAGHGAWGWKDPRTTLTLPFWRSLLPELQVLVCVRHPLDVARSLNRRNNTSVAYGQRLWRTYYEALNAVVSPAERLVTHCDQYFESASGELARLVAELGLPHDDAALASAVKEVEPSLRHHRAEADGEVALLAEDLLGLYASLCAEANRARPDASCEVGPCNSRGEAPGPAAEIGDRAAELAERDETIARLREALDEQTRLARAAEAAVVDLRRQVDELATPARRPRLGRLREALRSILSGRPRIDVLHPAWTVIGQRFNVQADGRAHVVAEGWGFGARAVLVIAGRPLDTHRASDRLLSAAVPDDLLGRPGTLPVWVVDRDGGRSAIRCFRVLTIRTAKASQPSTGSWRHPRNALRRVRWRASVTSGMVRLPLFYAQREWQRPRRRSPSAALPPGVSAHIRPPRVPRKPDVLCFPIIDWEFRYQRPQQILSRLTNAGHRVFYLSEQFLGPTEDPFHLRPLAPGVTEVRLRSPVRLNIYQDGLGGRVEEAVYEALLDFKAAAGLGETICVVHLPFWTPLVLRLKAEFGYRVVFDCLDDFSAFRNIGDRMLDLERTLAAHADVTTASSQVLARKHAAVRPILLPNAADYAHFSGSKPHPERLEGGPVLGYYGAIAHWFDVELVAGAASARPDWRFILIGRVDRDIEARLKRCPNVRLLDETRYADLPGYLAAFDVCLIPFVLDDLTRATNPVKFFEYLSAGKPVVAARLPELLPFTGDCFLYDGLSDFLAQTERALLTKDDPEKAASRRALARANTWDARVDVLRRAIRQLFPRVSVIVVTYNNLDLTRACVESLLEKTAHGDWELVIVDNASSDETPDFLRTLADRHPEIQIVLNDENRGFAAANNQGIRLSSGEFVVFLNNDTVVTHGWLGSLVRHLDDRAVGLVGPVTNNIGNEAKIETTYRVMSEMDAFADAHTRRHRGQRFDIPVLALFCAAIRRTVLDEVGLLDEQYEIGMFEDDDLSRTLRARGYRVVCAEDVFVHHVGRAAFGRLDPETYRRIFDANRNRYEEKWGEPWTPHRYRDADPT